MQGWSLDRKIQVTQTRVIEWYQKFEGKVYISFSGGKDSTVLLDIVRRVYPDMQAVFIDTGLEFPEIRNFVKGYDNVIWLKPEMNFRKVIETYGYPMISKEIAQKIYEARRKPDGVYAKRFEEDSEYVTKYGGRYSLVRWKWLRDSDVPISHKCCDVMKKKPAKVYEKQTGNKPIIATMADESSVRKQKWLKDGCNAFNSVRPVSTPMSFWTEQDVYKYIIRYIKPKYEAAWMDAQYSHGSARKKARKFLRKHGYSKTGIASVYGDIVSDKNGKYHTTGAYRTGCVFCMFGVHLEKEPNRFQRLKQTHPKLWKYCMKPWDEGGLGMREVLEYIGVKVE